MKIVLIGFMGSGKTTITKLLSQQLGLQPIDMDEIIIKRSGRSSDREIFEKDGEIVFREIEMNVAKELQKSANVVIATGGGIVMNSINLGYLKKNATVVFLKNRFDTTKKRLNPNNLPPLFRDQEKAQALYTLRLPLYQYYADITIDTDIKTSEEVTQELVQQLQIV